MRARRGERGNRERERERKRERAPPCCPLLGQPVGGIERTVRGEGHVQGRSYSGGDKGRRTTKEMRERVVDSRFEAR